MRAQELQGFRGYKGSGVMSYKSFGVLRVHTCINPGRSL